MKIYRFPTGINDSAFCRYASEVWQNSRKPYGDSQPDVDAGGCCCKQAAIKRTGGPYNPEKPLNSY